MTAPHWDAVYSARAVDHLSWTRPDAGVSAQLVDSLLDDAAAVVDVGGGAGLLVDHLLATGRRDVTVVDVSAAALAIARRRLVEAGRGDGGVDWIVADVRRWRPTRSYRVWHDRAVFYFLVDPADREAYRATAARAVEPGGALVVGTFAVDGPARCSGLPVCRYTPDELAAQFAPDFSPVAAQDEHHRTPRGDDQHFVWAVLRRGPGARRDAASGRPSARGAG